MNNSDPAAAGVAFISHPDCLLHDMGPHPECPARLAAVLERLSTTGLSDQLSHHEAPLIDLAVLEEVHTPELVHQVTRLTPAEGLAWLDGDTALCPASLRAARRAAGAMELALDLVLRGKCERAFCAVRPPGHHAERNRAMGFCLFNNIAIGAHLALNRHGLERVAVVDFDVHHGNGSEDILADLPGVLFCSTFQHPLYPHSGFGPTAVNVVNTPLAAGSGGTAFRAAVEEHWLPHLAEFAPQLILVSAGFDAHRADPLAGLELVEEDYAWVTRQLCEQADTSAQGRVISTLEGGYDLNALALSVEAHLRALLER